MGSFLRHTVWLSRLVLGAAVLLFSTIAARGLSDPAGSSAAHQILLGSAAAVTVARVLGIALDGPAPFTMHVLKPEIGVVVASAAALVFERRRVGSTGKDVTSGDTGRSIHHEPFGSLHS